MMAETVVYLVLTRTADPRENWRDYFNDAFPLHWGKCSLTNMSGSEDTAMVSNLSSNTK